MLSISNHVAIVPWKQGITLYFPTNFSRDAGRVVFFAPTVALVRQQYQELKDWFSARKVDYIVGPESEEKASVEVMIEFNQVRPQCLVFGSYGKIVEEPR